MRIFQAVKQIRDSSSFKLDTYGCKFVRGRFHLHAHFFNDFLRRNTQMDRVSEKQNEKQKL